MIILKLKGGLGNQMFQYAAAKLLSIKIDRPVKVNLNFFEASKKEVTRRNYCLDFFESKNITTTCLNNSIVYKFQYPFLKAFHHSLRLKEIDWLKTDDYKKFKEIVLDGYFFDLNTLQNNRKVVQSIFRFNENAFDDNKNLLNEINTCQSVSIHVRRGDYLTSVNEKIYHSCNKEYYLEAISHIQKKISSPCFYVFSDDIEWVKEELRFTNVICKYINLQTANKDMAEFFLMANCKHNIIANSTYSWWAAFLNKETDKTVIAPKFWYRNEIENTKALALIPSDWIVM